MGLKEDFEEHAEKAKTLPESTTNENKLILYGLFKQATVGPVNTRTTVSKEIDYLVTNCFIS
ncbi:Acyl-CoA-binding protein, ACBP, partial [Cynara cardunculus var. scolymus]